MTSSTRHGFTHFFWWLLPILSLALFAPSVRSATLFTALMDGQHLLMIRHADAPGFSDPAGFRVSDCTTQRNLGERGQRQARALGAWLAKEGIVSARMLSSPWCRCMDTAILMDKGVVRAEPALGSFFRDMSQAGSQTVALRRLLATEMKASPWKPLVLVTHQVNISAYTGQSVGQGDVMLVRVAPDGSYVSHRMISVPNFD
jgi:phosphohistidine phosphatase SixA